MIPLIFALLMQVSFAGEVIPPGAPLWSPIRDYNELGIREVSVKQWPPQERAKNEVRILLFGGFGDHVPLEKTFAKRLEHYLGEDSGRTIRVINASMPQDTPQEALVKLPALLEAYHPDYVFYFCYQQHVVRTAALETLVDRNEKGEITGTHFFTEDSYFFRGMKWILRLNESDDAVFLRMLNLQAGLSKLEKTLKASRDRAAVMRPYVRVMKEFKEATENAGAKFIVLWPGTQVIISPWSMEYPSRYGLSAVSLIWPFRQAAGATREQVAKAFRKENIPFVANYQARNPLGRNAGASVLDRQHADASFVETADKIGHLFAVSILATVF